MRIIVEDYDVKLSPVGAAGGSGKVERKLYQEGDSKLTVKFKGIDVPDGGQIGVVVAGSVDAKIIATAGKGKLSIESKSGDYVPQVQAGDKVELQYDGETILSGNFVPD